MNRPQILAIVLCVVLVVFLFFKGLQTSTSDLSNKPESSIPASSEAQYTEETFFENSLKTLSPELSDKLRTLNLDLKKSRNNDQKIDLINKAGSICDSLSLLGLTGYFAEKMADIKQTNTAWLYVANRYVNAIQFSQIPAERNYLIERGKKIARKILSQDASNMDAQNILAQCIIDQSDDSIMTVIPILKSIESKDSNNIPAIYNLALLSVKSGQLDKAVYRFKKLIKLQPMNAENYFRLADVLQTQGENKEALQLLEVCKSLVSDPEQIKVINSKIKELTTK